MNTESYINLLKDKSSEDNGNIKSERAKNHLHEDGDNAYKEHTPDKKQYSNDLLEKFINHVGFDTDEVPNFSRMAQLLSKSIKPEIINKDLTSLDNHDILKNDDQIRKEALKKLISKYRG